MSVGNASFDLTGLRRQRRTIVFADLVESVRLMQDHETDVIDRWRRFSARARDQVLPLWGGRLVRTAGDALLIECERAGPAVGLALALHETLQPFNEGRAESERMALRIGVHLADVLFDEHEAYGAGVNLAQRLSSLAPPGGTVLSVEARGELSDGVQADIQDLGMRYVKHLHEPVRAFAASPPQVEARRTARLPAGGSGELAPTIAVVPFQAMPPAPEYEALGHAMADDIIATISRHPGMRVLSRVTTAAVRDAAMDHVRLRQLLGASFVLTGRFYVRGDAIRLSAELCELREGRVVWAGNHRADIGALFEGQDELVPQIVAQVTQQVLAHELTRVRSLPMDSLASYSLFLGACGLLGSFVPADFAQAHELLEHLVERHPRQAMLRALLSNWHLFRILQAWSGDTNHDILHLQDHARRALDLDPELPDAWVAEGVARIVATRDFDAAQSCFLKALEFNPQHPMAWARLSETQRIAGQADDARNSAERALELSPLDPHRFILESFAASAALEANRLGDAQRHARAALRQHALFAPPHRVLICALWLDHQRAAAKAAAADCLRCLPNITVGSRVSSRPDGSRADTPFARALLAAGIPP